MAKSKKRQKKKPPVKQKQRATPRPQDQEEQSSGFGWIPLWGWILIFLVPLIISEFMFYTAGREASMILFPLAWIGFWVAIMQRAGWPIIKKRHKTRNDEDQEK